MIGSTDPALPDAVPTSETARPAVFQIAESRIANVSAPMSTWLTTEMYRVGVLGSIADSILMGNVVHKSTAKVEAKFTRYSSSR